MPSEFGLPDENVMCTPISLTSLRGESLLGALLDAAQDFKRSDAVYRKCEKRAKHQAKTPEDVWLRHARSRLLAGDAKGADDVVKRGVQEAAGAPFMLSAVILFMECGLVAAYFSAPKGDGHKNAVFTCLSMVVLAATEVAMPLALAPTALFAVVLRRT